MVFNSKQAMQDFKKLLSHLAPYKANVVLSMMSHIFMALFTVVSIPLIIPFFQILFARTPVDVSIPEKQWDIIGWLEYYFVGIVKEFGANKAILLVCGAIVFTFLMKNLFRYAAMYFMVPVRSGIVKDLRTNLYNHYLDIPYTDNNKRRGDLITRITADVQEVEWSILRFVETIFKSPIVIAGSILLMLSINFKLTLFVFVLMLFTALVIGTLSKTLKRQSMALQDSLSSMTSTVDESLDGNLMISVYRVKSFWTNKFEKDNNVFRRLLNKVSWRQDLSSPLSEFLGVTVVVILLWYGSKLVLNNELNPETFFAFIFAFYNVIEPSKSFSSAFYNIKKGVAALDRIDEVLPRQHTIDADGRKDFSFNQSIVFDNVSFAYEDQAVLKDVNFEIFKGEKLAIVGPSGAGKSTLVNLILNKIQPNKGSIYIDDQNLNGLDISSWYKKIGLVTQKPFLFNDTIESNISLGRRDYTKTQLENALVSSESKQFVSQLTHGVQSVIGDKGEQLSGGEQQRLTIARALLEDPELIIFDEPTSALDPESEKKVSHAITTALDNRTALVIAHRLSTVKQMDRILVLKSGQVVEQGNHEELISKNGVYAEYVKMQSLT